MNSEITDLDLMQRFNKFSCEEHLKRYEEYFKTETISNPRQEYTISLLDFKEEKINGNQ